MAIYRVTITRTLENVVDVEADSRFDALDRVNDIYKTEERTIAPEEWSTTTLSVDAAEAN